MKKRLLALALTVALVMAIAIPSFAAPSSIAWMNASGTSIAGTAIENSEYINLKGSSTSYSWYGIAKTGATKISWKEIKATDLTAAGTFNLEKLMKDAGTLYFVTGSKPTATGTSVPTGVNAISFAIPARAAKLTKTDVPVTYSYSGTDVIASIGSKTTLEWTYANAAGSWAPYVPGDTFVVGSSKVDLWVRTAATGTNAASSVLKVSIAAAKAAPTLKFDLTKGTLGLKAGMEISVNGGAWTKVADSIKAATVTGSPTSIGASAINIERDSIVQYRTPAADKTKPGTKVGTINLEVDSNPIAISPSNFFLTNKALMVSGETVVEMKVGTGADAKWKKIKSVKAADVVGKSITVRAPGDKTMLPGDETIITVATTGAIS